MLTSHDDYQDHLDFEREDRLDRDMEREPFQPPARRTAEETAERRAIALTPLPTCDGCGEQAPCSRFVVTHHDDTTSPASYCAECYCAECRDLAAMDWNGETKSIAPAPEVG